MAGETPLPPDRHFAEWVRALERRVSELEGARALEATTQRGGTHLLVSPTTGRNVRRDGVLTDGVAPFYGSVTYDGDGRSMFMVRDDTPGLIKPEIPAPFHAPVTATVTSGTFVSLFEFEPRRLYHDTLHLRAAVVTDPSGTAELRIRDTVSGRATDPVVVGVSKTAFAAFDWLHGVVLGDDAGGQSCSFRLEGRRTSGSGVVTVFTPLRAVLTSSVLVPTSATNGAPRLL
jgi:hypothetical protein